MGMLKAKCPNCWEPMGDCMCNRNKQSCDSDNYNDSVSTPSVENERKFQASLVKKLDELTDEIAKLRKAMEANQPKQEEIVVPTNDSNPMRELVYQVARDLAKQDEKYGKQKRLSGAAEGNPMRHLVYEATKSHREHNRQYSQELPPKPTIAPCETLNQKQS